MNALSVGFYLSVYYTSCEFRVMPFSWRLFAQGDEAVGMSNFAFGPLRLLLQRYIPPKPVNSVS